MDGPSQTNAPFQLLSVDPRLRTIQWLCHATWLRQLLLLEGTFRLNCLIKKRKKTSEKKNKKKTSLPHPFFFTKLAWEPKHFFLYGLIWSSFLSRMTFEHVLEKQLIVEEEGGKYTTKYTVPIGRFLRMTTKFAFNSIIDWKAFIYKNDEKNWYLCILLSFSSTMQDPLSSKNKVQISHAYH